MADAVDPPERFGDVDARARRARRRDAILLIPVIGAFLLVSPMIRAFARPIEVGGAPLIVVYVFVVWAALIAAAGVVAYTMRPSPRRGAEDETAADAIEESR